MSVKIKSMVLLQGVFDPSLFDLLKDRKIKGAFVMEGRPGLEAAISNCSELIKRKIKPTLVSDNMAGFLFYRKLVSEAWVSSVSTGAQGVLCRIGGLIVGVLGRRHLVPVYSYPGKSGSRLLGRPGDITHFNGVKIAPNGIKGYVPLTEWVEKKYIKRIYER